MVHITKKSLNTYVALKSYVLSLWILNLTFQSSHYIREHIIWSKLLIIWFDTQIITYVIQINILPTIPETKYILLDGILCTDIF